MTMLEFLEQDKNRFTEALENAATSDKAGKVIESEMDRILLRYNEGCEDAKARDAAACMLQTARLSAGLVDSVGEVKIWVNPQNEGKATGSMPLKAKLLAGASGVSMAAAMVIAFMTTSETMRATDVALAIILALAAPVLGLFAGKMSLPAAKASTGGGFGSHKDKVTNQNIEKRVDSQRIYSSLHNVLFAVDQNLQNLYGQENDAAAILSADSLAVGPGMISERELDLFAGLLEAAYSGDGEYALEKALDVKLYLHRNKIEAVDYDGKNREMFDFMPSMEERTIRPALVADGKIVRRGLASGR